MLMQLLPLIMAQQREGQANALGQAGLARQTERDQSQEALQRLGLEQSGQFHQGELEHQRAMEALGLRQANSQDAHQLALIQAQKDENQNRMNMEVVSHLMNNPNVPLEKALPLLGSLSPQLAKLGDVWHQGAVSSAMQAQLPALTGMYNVYNQGHDYAQLQKGLEAIRPTMSPEVYNGMPWDQLNSGMTPKPQGFWGKLFGGNDSQQFQGEIPQGLEGAFAQNQSANAAEVLKTQQQTAAYEAEQKKQAALSFLRQQNMKRAGVPTTFAEGMANVGSLGF